MADLNVNNSKPTQQTVYDDQKAVVDAAKKGGDDVAGATLKLVLDQAALDKQNGHSTSLADTKKYMDQFLKNNGADTSKLDQTFDDLAKTPNQNATAGDQRDLIQFALDWQKENDAKGPSGSGMDKQISDA